MEKTNPSNESGRPTSGRRRRRKPRTSHSPTGNAGMRDKKTPNKYSHCGVSASGSSTCHILDLPNDVVYIILEFLSPETLCRLSQSCQRFRQLASEDLVWLAHEKERTLLRASSSRCVHRMKERFRLSLNWESGRRHQAWLFKQNFRLLPWLQTEENDTLWVSKGNQIHKFDIQKSGRLRESPLEPLRGLNSDVTRFVVRNGIVVSGCRKGGVSTWEATSGVQLMNCEDVHLSDTQCVDVVDDLIVSGSRDTTVKVLSMCPDKKERVKKCFHMEDRVWSISASPDKCTVAVGTSGYRNPAVALLDIKSGVVLGHLDGEGCRRKFGVLDMKFESPNTLLTCGHDTYLRLWDLRSHTCVCRWEDPHDSAFYSLLTDGHYTMLTGTARHGLVRLWDKRHANNVQAYYSGKQHSPVYSMGGSTRHLYVALDMGLYFVDFSIR